MARTRKSKWSGPEALSSLLVPIADLTPDPDNARRHSERNLDAIVSSLSQFGQVKPIVVTKTGIVIAGNGTLAAARALEWSEIAVVRFTGTVKEAKALAIADNRTTDLSAWDYEILAEQIGELGDAFDVGFDAIEIEQIKQSLTFDGVPDDFLLEHDQREKDKYGSKHSADVKVLKVHLKRDDDLEANVEKLEAFVAELGGDVL